MSFTYDTTQLLWAFGLTLFAGLSTGIGSLIAFFAKRTNTSFLSFSLGLSAGVMIYVSFVELFMESKGMLAQLYGEKLGYTYSTLAFFGGVLFIAIIDRLIPEAENPHEIRPLEEMPEGETIPSDEMTEEKAPTKHLENKRLMRVGIVTALVLAIHNFPEGMVTFLAGLKDLNVAIPIAIAIAIHNIPEGVSVSIPIFYATGDRKKAFRLSFLSGLAEPLGAIVGYFLLAPYLNDHVFGILFAAIAGIMVYISLDELLPAAEEFGHHHMAIYGLILGMGVMAISLLIFM